MVGYEKEMKDVSTLVWAPSPLFSFTYSTRGLAKILANVEG